MEERETRGEVLRVGMRWGVIGGIVGFVASMLGSLVGILVAVFVGISCGRRAAQADGVLGLVFFGVDQIQRILCQFVLNCGKSDTLNDIE